MPQPEQDVGSWGPPLCLETEIDWERLGRRDFAVEWAGTELQTKKTVS